MRSNLWPNTFRKAFYSFSAKIKAVITTGQPVVMSQPSAKRQRIEDENEETRFLGRLFQDEWTELYFFIESSKGPKCLICKDILAINKKR